MSNNNVILVDDDADLRLALTQSLELAGLEVQSFGSAEEALTLLNRRFNGVVVSDIRMVGLGGIGLLQEALRIDAALPVILITGHADVETAVSAMRDGAYDFLEKPFVPQRLVQIVKNALDKRRLVQENRALRRQVADVDAIGVRLMGDAPQMQRLRDEVGAIASTDADALILGETGAGKDVVARALHEFSPRHKGPFVAINCGALPREMFESEVFGHEAGAFTSAQKQRIGKLEFANGGTVFLDEIESMPMDLQVKLLRVIEERSLERLGSNKAIPLDVRFVAASKTDLQKAGEAGQFRLDLFYRLNVVTLSIPPLRERKGDIPALFAHLCREARARYHRDIPDMTPQLGADLQGYDWPGNVRELRNIADRWVLGLWRGFNGADGAIALDEHNSLKDQMAAHEKALLLSALRKYEWRMKDVYEALGLSRKGLYDKLQRHNIAMDE